MRKEIKAYLSAHPGADYIDILSNFAPWVHKAGYPKGYSNFSRVRKVLEDMKKRGEITNDGRKIYLKNPTGGDSK